LELLQFPAYFPENQIGENQKKEFHVKHKQTFITIALLAVTAFLSAPRNVFGQKNKKPLFGRLKCGIYKNLIRLH